MFHLYFNTDSIFELNVVEHLKDTCEKNFAEFGATEDLFDPVLSQVKLNLRDTFRRFVKSEIFLEAKKSLKKNRFKPL